MEKPVILVDKCNNSWGLCEKIETHEKGYLHRAFSIFVFNKDYLLMQKRAENKYHSGELWSNTCCSHPRYDETTYDTAHKRLQKEMGFDTKLKEIFWIQYNLDVGNGLRENELNHILVGDYDKDPIINPKEVSEYKWIKVKKLYQDMDSNPKRYTPWLPVCLDLVVATKFRGINFLFD